MREIALQTTNKKLTAVAHRCTNQMQEQKRINLALERQINYLEQRMQKLLEMTDPESANVFKRETRRNLHKI